MKMLHTAVVLGNLEEAINFEMGGGRELLEEELAGTFAKQLPSFGPPQ